MKNVWAVWHVYEDESGNEESKFIGVFSSEERANQVVASLRNKQGFRDHPIDCFEVHEQVIDLVGWSDGFAGTSHDEEGG